MAVYYYSTSSLSISYSRIVLNEWNCSPISFIEIGSFLLWGARIFVHFYFMFSRPKVAIFSKSPVSFLFVMGAEAIDSSSRSKRVVSFKVFTFVPSIIYVSTLIGGIITVSTNLKTSLLEFVYGGKTILFSSASAAVEGLFIITLLSTSSRVLLKFSY